MRYVTAGQLGTPIARAIGNEYSKGGVLGKVEEVKARKRHVYHVPSAGVQHIG